MPKQRKKQRLQKPKPLKNNSQEKIHLGSVGKPHGVVGAFFVNGRIDQIPEVETIYVGNDESSAQPAKIIRNYVSGGRPVLQIESISSREELTKFAQQKIFAELSQIDFDPETEFLFNDVVGKKVEYKAQDGSQQLFGIVTSIYETPSNLNICIEKDNQEIDLPLNADYFDLTFDRKAENIFLHFNSEDLKEFWTKKRGSK